MIEVVDVTVLFGRTLALDRVSTSIGDGIVGLFGPNASGKSTLLRVVAGLHPPTHGAVSIDGGKRIGYAGHASGLYTRLSVAENLELFQKLHGCDLARVASTIEKLDLEGFAATPVGMLSAGLQRRAAVARALLHDPDILLLDEPYANLDDAASELVSSATRDWWQPGRTAVIATHGAKKVRGIATAGIVLQRGRIAATPDYTTMEAPL